MINFTFNFFENLLLLEWHIANIGQFSFLAYSLFLSFVSHAYRMSDPSVSYVRAEIPLKSSFSLAVLELSLPLFLPMLFFLATDVYGSGASSNQFVLKIVFEPHPWEFFWNAGFLNSIIVPKQSLESQNLWN